ncbi:MAG TPA: hypothetical protein VGH73_24450 [Thermoanaerobaculia bacterium]
MIIDPEAAAAVPPAKTRTKRKDDDRLGEILKQAAALSGVCYVFGFLILNSSLGNLGIYEFSLTNSRVVAAGLLYLGLSLLSGVGWVAALMVAVSLQAVAQWSKPRLYASLGLSWVAGSIFGLGFCWVLWAGIYGHRMAELGPAALWWVLCNSAALVLLAGGGLYSLTGKGGLLGLACGMILMVVALWIFGSALHPKIPGLLGGGKPQRVQLLVKPEAAAFLKQLGLPGQPLPAGGGKAEGAWSLTAPVDLIDAGSDVYILKTLSSSSRALVLAKDNVQGIAHLR